MVPRSAQAARLVARGAARARARRHRRRAATAGRALPLRWWRGHRRGGDVGWRRPDSEIRRICQGDFRDLVSRTISALGVSQI